MPRGKPSNTVKQCVRCSGDFLALNNYQKYCCVVCKRKAYQTHGPETTERQYALISGNWSKYFNRLCTRSFKRGAITRDDCIALLETQGYKCALTGVELTCKLEKGVVCKTNASLDRKDPKGPYTIANVHLVCAAVNKFRIDTPLDEFIDWCKKVSDYAVQKP